VNLNDLFVHPKYRGKGIGKVLMNHTKKFALNKNSKGLTLETSIYNPAQRLYERLGWKKDTDVFHYTWEA
jgi:GNAT superfamily N-acetyltransferase